MAEVVQLYTALTAGEPMESHTTVDIVEGGLVGDRYLRGTGHYAPYDVCEVTLVEGEALDTIREAYDIDLWDGRHRRNIVTRGLSVHDLLESTFRIGEVELRGTRPRPPCTHLEQVANEEGVGRALGDHRGGICATVLSPGTVAVGDSIAVVEPDPRTVGAGIVDRLKAETEQTNNEP
jgi:MOSC domain-containing protein YiiM